VPATERLLKKDSFILALIKPQFEARKGLVGKGGIRGFKGNREVFIYLKSQKKDDRND
jgi:predicted rRNA methylase YqxC with S4 and FtsJ domains